ncbi:site-2 protease family protein [soil metagenome]
MSEQSLLTRFYPFHDMPAAEAQTLAEEVRALVAGDMLIESTQITRDQRNQGALILRGRLLRPSHEVFPRWLAELNRRGYTPMLRPVADSLELNGTSDQVALHVISGVVTPRPSNYWINIGLFIVTLISTLFVGSLYSSAGVVANSLWELLSPLNLIKGWPFAFTLLGILTAHEFGHYFAARYHKVAVTLPYFIPLPLPMGPGGGTLGAFIRLKEPVPDRRKLFDIGVAGPLAGLVLAIPLLFIGLSLARVGDLPRNVEITMEGNSILYYLAKLWAFGRPLPDWVAMKDVLLDYSPVASAAWFGLLVTSINLLPLGQLDGGHTVFALFGEKARYINRIVIGVMLVLAVASLEPLQRFLPVLQSVGYSGWFLWLILIFFLVGPYHPPALDDVTTLDRRRRWIGYLVILIFVLIFVPVPIRII